VKIAPVPTSAALATLQSVLDQLADDRSLSPVRKRDFRSAITSFAKLRGQPPAAIPIDLSNIRHTLDSTVPVRAKVSPKRWANLRCDLAAAIKASGLRPMLRTADLHLDKAWARLLVRADQRMRAGLSRFARWASLRGISPERVDYATIERFIGELDAATLVRNLRVLRGTVARTWNALVRQRPAARLHPVAVPLRGRAKRRIAWQQLPAAFRDDAEAYLAWAAMPDPLADGARAKALAPLSLRLKRTQIHSAAHAAIAAGIPLDRLTSLASLVELDTFRDLLRHRWQADGKKLSFYTNNMAIALTVIATEWVQLPADKIATLRALRAKLGAPPTGLTEKNKALLRNFDDPRLLSAMLSLPDRLWQNARRGLTKSRRPFIDLQSALAIDILLHTPLRMQNLSSLNFNEHLHWPQGRRKPALMIFKDDETKNDEALEFELPAVLADRLQMYRTEIAPAIIGKRPDVVFVGWTGRRRTQAAIKIAIERTVLRQLGIKMTPHQFRHLAAKIILDENPGALELVREMMGHKNLKTTRDFYAGVDTRRAGRAHAALLMKLRESTPAARRPRRTVE
jgi:integrase